MKKQFSILLLAAALLSACNAPQFQTTKQSDVNRLTKSASFKMPKVDVPSFPNRTFNVLDYGADPTGVVLSTEAIQQAIDECTELGGGTVIIPEGIYTTQKETADGKNLYIFITSPVASVKVPAVLSGKCEVLETGQPIEMSVVEGETVINLPKNLFKDDSIVVLKCH